MIKSIITETISTARCVFMDLSFTSISLLIIAERPNIKRRFAMFAPRTFPITISEALFVTESIEENNSGRLVPIAIIVIPMMNGDKLNERPIFSADSVNHSDDFARTAREEISINIQIIISIIVSPYRIKI